MGKTVAEVFGTEKNSALAAAEIFAMRIDMENRTVEAKIAPAKTIHKSEIYTLQSKICEKLGIQNVRLVPVYSPSLLGDDYFGDIAAEAARRGVPVNGFFNGCSAHFGDGKLEIELAHGGMDILLRERCDKVMQQIIREEFGTEVKVVFSGVTEVDMAADNAELFASGAALCFACSGLRTAADELRTVAKLRAVCGGICRRRRRGKGRSCRT